MMKKTTLTLTFLLISLVVFGQKYVNMTDELSDINGHLVIDGNELQVKYNTREQIIVTGDNMVLNDRSSFMFHNIIVQLSGKIIVQGLTRPTFADSYIFCKDSGALVSNRIIEVKNFDDVIIADVNYIKHLSGDPQIWVYNIQGKRVFKGTKSEARNYKLPISRYDVKVIGLEFVDKILFAAN